ncbi:hypothetical protein ACET3Z_020803 [Daucus carota]
MVLKTPHQCSYSSTCKNISISLFFLLLIFCGVSINKILCQDRNIDQNLVQNRRLLAKKFDFSPFQHPHHRHRHHHHHSRHAAPAEPEIDPRYGVDKRLVPSGPNPLHH